MSLLLLVLPILRARLLMTTEKVPTSCRRQFHVRAKENPNDVVKEHSKDLLYGAILKKRKRFGIWVVLNSWMGSC